VHLAPAGQTGGQYKPLSEQDIRAIYDAALRLLAELGMGEVPNRLRKDLEPAGADSGKDGASTLQDLNDFTRLQDTFENISWFTRCCIANDMPDEWSLDVNTAFALMKNTTKPVATAFTLAPHVAPIVELFDIAAGGQGEFSKRPFVKAHISPVISPMRCGEDAVDVVYECIAHNIPMSCITAAQSGATAPATLPGFWRNRWPKRWPVW
jgi:trimethylamine:corrinoid methyltransferase-like protein